MTPQYFIGLGTGILIATLFMALSQLKPVNERALSIEAQARKQGMIYEGECRVNWGSENLSGTTGEKDDK